MADTQPQVHALLTDGATVRIRRAGPDDRDEILRLYEEMSPENLRLRFFTASHRPSEPAADRVVKEAGPSYWALVAETADRIAGVVEYETTPDTTAAEIRGWAPCCWNISSTPHARRASPRSPPTRSPRTTKCSRSSPTWDCAPPLFGYRGGGPVDIEGLEQLLLRLSRMACDLPQPAETDLNPVIARPADVTALDVRVRLPRRAHDPYLRRGALSTPLTAPTPRRRRGPE